MTGTAHMSLQRIATRELLVAHGAMEGLLSDVMPRMSPHKHFLAERGITQRAHLRAILTFKNSETQLMQLILV